MIDDRTDITPDAALAALAVPLPPLHVAPWPDAYGTLKLTGLFTVEIVALRRDDASWPANLTEAEVGALDVVGDIGNYPYYEEARPVLVHPDGMPGVWGRGASLQEASEALCARMLELLRDLPALLDALRHGSNFYAAVAKDRQSTDFVAKARPLMFLFHDRGYEFEQAAVLARAAQALAEHDLAADSQAILDKTQGRVTVKPEALAERVKPKG